MFQSVEVLGAKLKGLKTNLSKVAHMNAHELHLEFICWQETSWSKPGFVGCVQSRVFVTDSDAGLLFSASLGHSHGQAPTQVLLWGHRLVVVYSGYPLDLIGGLSQVDTSSNPVPARTVLTKRSFGGDMSWHLVPTDDALYFLDTDKRIVKLRSTDLQELDVTPPNLTEVQDFVIRLKPEVVPITLDNLGNLAQGNLKVDLDKLFQQQHSKMISPASKFVPYFITHFPIGILVAGVLLDVDGNTVNGLMLVGVGTFTPISTGVIQFELEETLSQFRYCCIGLERTPGFLCKDDQRLYLCSTKDDAIYTVATVDNNCIQHIVNLGASWIILGTFDCTQLLTIQYIA